MELSAAHTQCIVILNLCFGFISDKFLMIQPLDSKLKQAYGSCAANLGVIGAFKDALSAFPV